MKKLLMLLLVVTTNAFSATTLKLYVDSKIYFVSNEKPATIKQISQMEKHYGGFNEVHSSPKWGLRSGGEWSIETRLSTNNEFNILFWTTDKDQPKINQNFDLSTLVASSYTLLKTSKGELKINIIPKELKETLPPIELSLNNFGLNHFCLKNSAIIINDTFYSGAVTGFAKTIELRFPDYHDIDIALKPLNDWQQIGIYKDGKITIDIDAEHFLSIFNVGIGPSGYQKGGPFKVYGAIKPPTHNRSDSLASDEQHSYKGVSKRIKTIITKAKRENKFSVIGITTKNGNSKHLENMLGDIFTRQNCG